MSMRLLVFAILAGLLSGASLALDFDFSYVPGALFAFAVLAASGTRFARVGPLRALSFIGMSVLANYVAVQAALHSDHTFDFIGNDAVVGGVAGFVGSTILGIATALIFRMRPFVRTVATFALVGTAAGAVFFYLPHASLAYALWQGAIALVIANAWATRRAQ